jgi:hypothetical protein
MVIGLTEIYKRRYYQMNWLRRNRTFEKTISDLLFLLIKKW